MSVLTHDSQIRDTHQHGRECVRPFTGYSRRHLRRKAEALARQLRKQTGTTITIAIIETSNGNDQNV